VTASDDDEEEEEGEEDWEEGRARDEKSPVEEGVAKKDFRREEEVREVAEEEVR